MRQSYSIMKWACAVALVSGISLMSAHGAFSVLRYTCWPTQGQKCNELYADQCTIQAGTTYQGPCVDCRGNASLFNGTCVPVNNDADFCTTNGTSINCGNKYTGTCSLFGDLWLCLNETANGQCTTVYQCS